MKRKIGPFTIYNKKPCDIQYGTLYTLDIVLPVPHCCNRTLRVYLPEDFSFEKRYPVLYMLDGQNIVDKYTTAYGAWDIDVRQHEYVEEGGRQFIVVGLDCPRVGHKYRVREYTLMGLDILFKKGEKIDPHPYSDVLMDYLVNVLKPLVDRHFPTLRDRENTAIGGSSMGGLASFNFATSYKDVFGFALCFSPAFHIYDHDDLYRLVDKLNLNPYEYGKFFFYTGAVDFEGLFLEPTKEMYYYMLNRGFNEEQVGLSIDLEKTHCEAAWSEHFNEAIKFWLG